MSVLMTGAAAPTWTMMIAASAAPISIKLILVLWMESGAAGLRIKKNWASSKTRTENPVTPH